ncbi:MAG: sugar ABC transporter permease [Ruminiclostridium sp.]|nr:sugar ABC transporter permease [Ruminiclostridium sp.]
MNTLKVLSSSSRVLKKKESKFRVYMRNNYSLYLFLILPAAYFIIFRYIPMYGVQIAFRDFNLFEGIWKSPWIGLDAFREIFSMEEFHRALRNTFMLNFLDLLTGFPTPIILAIILSELKSERFKKFSQTILYLPYFLSWVIIGSISLQLFSPQSGLINLTLNKLGLDSIPFLTNKWAWLGTYNLLGIWQSAGWNTIIFLAAITGINVELYEAATVDGAGRLRRIWHITLPGIRSTIVTLLILNLGRIVTIGFDRPYVIGNTLVRDFSDVISTYVYRVGLQSFRLTIATAVGLFQSVVGVVFLLITNFLAKKIGEDGIF